MFKGQYNFFEYKYNISGYNGQDFGGVAQYVYLVISFVLLILFLVILRKASKEKVLKVIRYISIFLIAFYVVKTTWESIYDIKLSGSFNTYLLPLDTCSLIMYAGLIAGFSSGKIKHAAECWLATGGIVGGLANMVFLNAFKYYPFWSFGAFYSMIWHFLMVFLGIFLIVTNYVDIKKYSNVIYGFLFHLVISLVVIPIDFKFGFDFMMYRNLGGVPIFEGIADKLMAANLQFLNPVLMLLLYFLAFSTIFGVSKIIFLLKRRPRYE